MNSRERVMTALNHLEPDRVPVDMKLTIDVYKELRLYLGLLHLPEQLKMGQWTEVEMPIDMIQALDLDIYYTASRRVDSVHSKTFEDGSFVDEWGVYWKKTMVDNGHFYFEVQNPPLANASIADLDAYEWPDPTDPGRFSGMREELEVVRSQTDLAILAKLGGAVFEVATFMRGHERWYRDLVSNQPFAHALMAKIAFIQKEIDRRGLDELGDLIDIFRIGGEDLGMQDRPLVSPKTFKNVLKPHLKELWSYAKARLLEKNP
ncbi:MAG: uroporphyrinogen decarboxylase family protein, partial [Eubacterium sp.]